MELTQEALHSILDYDPLTGIFRWKTRWKGCQYNIGDVAKRKGKDSGPYADFYIGGPYRQCVLAHRLAWLYVHGYWPNNFIDHIDRNKRNNAIANLREATKRQNAENHGVRRDNKLGMTGIYYRGDAQSTNRVKPYEAHLDHFREYFATLKEAIEWREEMVKLHHPFFTRLP